MKNILVFLLVGGLHAQAATYRFNNHVDPNLQVVRVASFQDGYWVFAPFGESVELEFDGSNISIGGYGTHAAMGVGNWGGFTIQPTLWPDDPAIRVVDIVPNFTEDNIEGRLSDGESPLTLFKSGIGIGSVLMVSIATVGFVRWAGRTPLGAGD